MDPAPLDPAAYDAVLREDFTRYRGHSPLPPAVVNGILRLHAQGWAPSRIARELNYWRKPRLFPHHNEWSAIDVRVVIAVAGDDDLRRSLTAA